MRTDKPNIGLVALTIAVNHIFFVQSTNTVELLDLL